MQRRGSRLVDLQLHAAEKSGSRESALSRYLFIPKYAEERARGGGKTAEGQ